MFPACNGRRWMPEVAAAGVLTLLATIAALPHFFRTPHGPPLLAQVSTRRQWQQRRWTELWSDLPERQWMRCGWWSSQLQPAPLPAKSNGFLQVDCAGGLNQMRRDVSSALSVL